MNWMHLVWIVLYFAVGWATTEAYDLDDSIWGLLVFLLWPLLVAVYLVVAVLLLLFGVLFMLDELLHRHQTKKKGAH